MNSKVARAAVALLVLLFLPAGALASDFVVGRGDPSNLLLRSHVVPAYETIEVRTQGCTTGEDTVLFMLQGSGDARTTIAYNDDGGGGQQGLCSWMTYTNGPQLQSILVVATTYSPNSPASVSYQYRRSSDNQWTSSNVTIGGFPQREWLYGTYTFETIPLRPADGGGAVDTVLYVLDTTVGGTTWIDDDDGLSRLSKTPETTMTGLHYVVAGVYGGGTGNDVEVWAYDDFFDPEQDGVPNEIETARGTSQANSDSDDDGARDGEELRGIAASNLAGGDKSVVLAWQSGTNDTEPGADPLVQDLWVEVDYMTAPGDHDHDPRAAGNWTNFASELRWLWWSDSGYTGRNVRSHVQIDQSLTHFERISWADCQNSNTVQFHDIKGNANYFNPLRASVYHYAIVAHQLSSLGCNPIDASGWAEIWGNDLIVALGDEAGDVGTIAQQRGTFMHELGHNLALTHNLNNNPTPENNSCVHSSVMNYRYSFNGYGGPYIRGFGFSNGTCTAASNPACPNTCDSTYCVPAFQQSVKGGCGTGGGDCDCDQPEWADMMLDIPGTGLMDYVDCQFWYYDDCLGQGAASSGRRAESPGQKAQLSNRPGLRAYFLGKQDANNRAGHQAFGRSRKNFLEKRGLREGTDFQVDAASGRMYAIE